MPDRLRAHEKIAAALRELGVDARPIDGWVYVALPAGVMCISAESGASLDVERYPLTPSWFVAAPTDREPRPEPTAGAPSTYQQFLRELGSPRAPMLFPSPLLFRDADG